MGPTDIYMEAERWVGSTSTRPSDSDLLPHGSPNEHETYICRLVMVHHYRKSVLARAIATPITTLTEAEHLNRYHTCAEKRLKLIVQFTFFLPGRLPGSSAARFAPGTYVGPNLFSPKSFMLGEM